MSRAEAPTVDESAGSTEAWMRVLTTDERRDLHRTNALRSWLSFAVNWSLVAAAFALVAWMPNPLTILFAIFVIGARQLGCAILMHEAAHRSLFRTRELNDWAGNWLAAYPVWLDVAPYRTYHLKHHKNTWTELDPDLALATPFPITVRSFGRKVWRDLSGQTGWKRAVATYRRDLGRSRGKVKRDGSGWLALRGVVITNAILLGILALAGHPELYVLWVVAWFTTFSLVMRIRSIAEHAMIDDPADPLGNTRTTVASWWERLLLAPNRVNYHLEHHLMMSVPHYNLPRMHRMLGERGVLYDACVAHGYREVLRRATSASAGTSGERGANAGAQSLTFG
jgi:fatty acid desaturase